MNCEDEFKIYVSAPKRDIVRKYLHASWEEIDAGIFKGYGCLQIYRSSLGNELIERKKKRTCIITFRV